MASSERATAQSRCYFETDGYSQSGNAGPESFVRSVVFGSLVATISAVAYCYLRAEKDGTSVADLAAILAREVPPLG